MFTKTPVNQVIFFENGTKRHIKDVVLIEQGNWFHLLTKSGQEIIVNPDKILFIKSEEV